MFCSELEALKRERAHEMGQSTKHSSGEVTTLQQKLDQAVEEKEREVRHPFLKLFIHYLLLASSRLC